MATNRARQEQMNRREEKAWHGEESNQIKSLTLRSHVDGGGEEGSAGDEPSERARMTIRWVPLAAVVERRGEELRREGDQPEAPTP